MTLRVKSIILGTILVKVLKVIYHSKNTGIETNSQPLSFRIFRFHRECLARFEAMAAESFAEMMSVLGCVFRKGQR